MNFLGREIRDGYTVLPEIKKLWAVELDLLERFIKICQEHSLTYYAMFGTMLGAVRHGGFIPWDDDIDVVMPRADYDKLKAMPGLFKEPYFLQTPENDPAACQRYMKLRNSGTAHIPPSFPNTMIHGGNLGISIDIMPLDDVSSRFSAKRLAKSAARCHKLRYLCASIGEMGWDSTPEWKRKHCVEVREFSYDELTARYHRICSRGSGKGKYCTVAVIESDHAGLCLKKADFAEPVYMDFEHLKIAVPNGYTRLIDTIYDEGMALPEEINRKPTHEGLISTDTSYKVYTAPYTDIFRELDKKRLFLFGAGDSMRIFVERYGRWFQPECTFDNDSKKWGTLAHGIPVRSPKELPGMYDDNSAIIIVSLYHKSIGEQLCEMGICDYRIYMDGWNYNADGVSR